jgi:hypothetical protein
MEKQAAMINDLHKYMSLGKSIFADTQDYYLFGYLCSSLYQQYSIHKVNYLLDCRSNYQIPTITQSGAYR